MKFVIKKKKKFKSNINIWVVKQCNVYHNSQTLTPTTE